MLLPETTAAESRNFAERILRRVATHDFGEPGKPVRVTISIGIASLPRRAGHRRRIAAPPGRQPPLSRQERRPEPVSRLSTRRCPRCQTTYPAPARYCVKDGSPLVDVEPTASFGPPTMPAARAGRTRPGALRGVAAEEYLAHARGAGPLRHAERQAARPALPGGSPAGRRRDVVRLPGAGHRVRPPRRGEDSAAPAVARSGRGRAASPRGRRSPCGSTIRTSAPSCGWARRTG